MRRAARVDDNQRRIVSALRQIGATVFVTSSLGGGFPDLVVGYRGKNFLLEIKDGEKIPSKRRLTRDEEAFILSWNGSVDVVKSVDEAILAVAGRK